MGRRDQPCVGLKASLVGGLVQFAFAVLLLVVLLPAAQARAAGTPCASIATDSMFPGAKIASAQLVPAAKGLPAYCEVKGTASPTPGSRIGVVYRLPEAWNGKLLGIGGGGWAGNVTLEAAAEGLTKGYAVAETDSGHPSADGVDMAWALTADGKRNVDTIDDFGWRAVHVMTVLGKQVLDLYYGKPATKAYFQGCSTGGRQGLMEAQRFPDDYDGVIAGDPVYDFTVQTSAVMRTQFFHADPDANMLPAQANLLNKAVLDACDGLDGLKDGIITDPRACRWDPVALQCKAGQSPPDCLTAKQVETARKAYEGLKTSGGRVVAWPLMRGGEIDWIGRSIGNARSPLGSNAVLGSVGIQVIIYQDPKRDLLTMAPDAMLRDIDANPFTAAYESKDTDIRKFAARGGKLLLYHGMYDPGPSVLSTIKYFEAAKTGLGGRAGQTALFIVPGMYHCRGGPGPDQFDSLDALDNWVTTSAAPAVIPASNKASGIERPLCPYPALPAYDGKGDPKALASFACKVARPKAN
jgi:feruloyl esterase